MSNIKEEYTDLKTYYDNTLNTLPKRTSNDEPTPIGCVEEMLDKIPKNVWKKNIKILDPCCGFGNFFVKVYHILREFHTTKQILENMLYFNDIDDVRLREVKKVFLRNEYKLNITQTDYLHYSEDQKYDIIVANPPYAKIMKNGKRASKNHNLIGLFLEKSLKLLKKGGYLLFITPDNWMSLADRNKLIKTITSLQIIYLNIHTAKRWFPKIGSSFTWYVIENKEAYKNMIVEGKYKNQEYISEVPSCERNFIPLYFTNIINNILLKTILNDKLEKYVIETSSDLHRYTKRDLISNVKDKEHPYKLIHTPTQIVYASRPHKYQEGYKVFIPTTSTYKLFVDKCGMTQSIAFIRCESKEEAENIVKILSSPLYVFINNICRWGNFNNVRILQLFPVSNSRNTYKFFNITKEEQEIIEKYK